MNRQNRRRLRRLNGSSPAVERALDSMEKQPRHQAGELLAPTVSPLEAMLFDLQRIARKAAAGLKDAGPMVPRGWHGSGMAVAAARWAQS